MEHHILIDSSDSSEILGKYATDLPSILYDVCSFRVNWCRFFEWNSVLNTKSDIDVFDHLGNIPYLIISIDPLNTTWKFSPEQNAKNASIVIHPADLQQSWHFPDMSLDAPISRLTKMSISIIDPNGSEVNDANIRFALSISLRTRNTTLPVDVFGNTRYTTYSKMCQ